MDASLTEEVLAYQRSRVGLDALLGRIAIFVYRYPRGRFGWNEDDCSEFFCFFYPKLARLVERFRYQGKPFEVYLLTTLKWQLRTYASRQMARELRVRVLTQQSFWAGIGRSLFYSDAFQWAGSADPPGEIEIPREARILLKMDGRSSIVDPSLRRRLLLLALACAYRMSDVLLERLALLTGYDREWLQTLIEALRLRVEAQRERATRLAERRNGCFFRIYCLQEQIRLCGEERVRSELTRQMLLEKDRLSAVLEELSRIPLCPTHRDIAEVLGIPKGTVDSGLYYLKGSLGPLSS